MYQELKSYYNNNKLLNNINCNNNSFNNNYYNNNINNNCNSNTISNKTRLTIRKIYRINLVSIHINSLN
jgi:hypothetical protein